MNSQTVCPRSKRIGLIAAGALLLSSNIAYGDLISDWLDGWKEGGKVSLNVRARYEFNEQSNAAKDINGYSVRTRLGYTTGVYEGVQGMIEFEDVSFADNADRPALDVPTTELNQAWLKFGSTKIGRQIYTFDDQRFIGHVGWRQNIQTYDAISTSFLVNEDAKLNFGYLNRVLRVNASKQDLAGFLANGSYKVSDALTVVAFAYLLDFENPVLASSDTYGVRATGKFATEAVKFSYEFSYAKQMDNSGSATDFDLDYLAGKFGANVSGVTLAVGFDFKGGDGTTGFTTPLATVHAFDGFADVFAGNSLGLGGGLPLGLKDSYAQVGYTIPGGFPLTVVYHKFETDEFGVDLGTEIDAVVSHKINDYLSVLAKYGRYEADVSAGYGSFDKTIFTFEFNLAY